METNSRERTKTTSIHFQSKSSSKSWGYYTSHKVKYRLFSTFTYIILEMLESILLHIVMFCCTVLLVPVKHFMPNILPNSPVWNMLSCLVVMLDQWVTKVLPNWTKVSDDVWLAVPNNLFSVRLGRKIKFWSCIIYRWSWCFPSSKRRKNDNRTSISNQYIPCTNWWT